MSTLSRARTDSKSLIGGLAAVMLCTTVATSNAQYQYVPSRDYYHNDTVEGTVVGGAFGAITGAIIGGKKDRGEGALIARRHGALTGNLLGKSKDRADEQRAAAGSAAVANANQRAAARAVTNYDLIRLTQAGLSDDVIISTIRAHGARLDLGPDGLIALKENGVSDRILVAAQDLTQSSGFVTAAPTTIIAEPVPRTVIVAPRAYYYPRGHYHYGRHYRYPHHARGHGHSHGSLHYRVRF